jgi:putative ABC transport system permease protein
MRSRQALLAVLASAWRRGSLAAAVLGAAGAAAGIAAWCAVDALGGLAGQVVERTAAEGALPSLVVTAAGGVDAASLERLAASPPVPVRAVLPRQLGTARLRAGEREREVLVLGADLAKEALARPGRFARRGGSGTGGAGAPEAVVVDAATAAALGIEPGATLVLRTDRDEVQVRLAATLTDLGPHAIAAGVAIVELATASRLLGRNRADQAEVLLAPEQDPDAARGALAASLGPGFAVAPSAHRGLAAGSPAALRTTWRLAAWLALAFAAIALVAAIGDQVRSRARPLALLRALGAGPGLRAAILVAPAIGIALAGALAGGLLGPWLAERLRPGFAAWIAMQTDTGVLLEPQRPTAGGWLALCGGAASFAVATSLWLARRDRRHGGGTDERDGGARAFAGRRLLAAALAFGTVSALGASGALRLGAPVRALDLAAGLAAVALAAPPLAAAFARLAARGSAGALRLLAAKRLAHEPGALLGAGRLLAVAFAFALALLAAGASLRGAVPGAVRASLPGDLIATTLPQVLGLPGDALQALPVVRGVAGARPGRLGLDVRLEPGADAAAVGTELLRALPAGSVVLRAVDLRARAAATAGQALDMLDAAVLLLLGPALCGALAFFALDDVRGARRAHRLRAVGATPRQQRVANALAGAWLGAGAGVSAVAGGLLLGHVWTRGALRDLLGWDCAFVVPWPACLAAAAAAPLLSAAAAALAGTGPRSARPPALTAW